MFGWPDFDSAVLKFSAKPSSGCGTCRQGLDWQIIQEPLILKKTGFNVKLVNERQGHLLIYFSGHIRYTSKSVDAKLFLS